MTMKIPESWIHLDAICSQCKSRTLWTEPVGCDDDGLPLGEVRCATCGDRFVVNIMGSRIPISKEMHR